MNSPITPLSDRIVVEKVEKKETTHAGIILPRDTESSEHNIGVVVAVGEGRTMENGSVVKPQVSVGQKVMFSWGDKIEIGGKEYYVVSESSVLGIINN